MLALIIITTGCVAKNNYQSAVNNYQVAADLLIKSEFNGCCGFVKNWVRVEEKFGSNRNWEEDIRICASQKSFSNPTQPTATVLLLECMKDYGWELQVEELIITQ